MKHTWLANEDIQHFETHGWVIVRDVLQDHDLATAREALFEVYPTPAAVAEGGDDPRVTRYAAAAKHPREGGKRTFSPEQYLGIKELPTGVLAFDVVPFHPRLISLAEALLGTREVRLYQADPYAKYQGVTDYDQPLHIDYTNHSMLPPRPQGRPMQIQLFLYLSDVTAGSGPTHIVSRKHTESIPMMDLTFQSANRNPAPIAPEHEVAAIAPAGSAMVYSSDVVHRGTTMTEPGEGRFTYNLGYRRADAEWAGGSPFARKGGAQGWKEMIGTLAPRQLEILGFPPLGDAYWTDETIDGLAARYPSLDVSPWLTKSS